MIKYHSFRQTIRRWFLSCFHTLLAAVNTSWFIWFWFVFFSPPDICNYASIDDHKWIELKHFHAIVRHDRKVKKTKRIQRAAKAMALKTNMTMPTDGSYGSLELLSTSTAYNAMNLTKSRCHCCYFVWINKKKSHSHYKVSAFNVCLQQKNEQKNEQNSILKKTRVEK